MRDVVLDENVLIKGLSAEDSGLQSDELCAQLITLVQDRHRWVISSEVLRRYNVQIDVYGRARGAVVMRLIKSLAGVLRDQDRLLFLQHPTAVTGSYHEKDQPLVALAAAATDAVFVTTDNRLVGQLTKEAIPENRGFSVLEPADALKVLR